MNHANYFYNSKLGKLDPSYFKKNRKEVITYQKIMTNVNHWKLLVSSRIPKKYSCTNSKYRCRVR